MTERRLRESGMTAADAAAASRTIMGNDTLAREDARAVWTVALFESLWQDLRYGLLAGSAFRDRHANRRTVILRSSTLISGCSTFALSRSVGSTPST